AAGDQRSGAADVRGEAGASEPSDEDAGALVANAHVAALEPEDLGEVPVITAVIVQPELDHGPIDRPLPPPGDDAAPWGGPPTADRGLAEQGDVQGDVPADDGRGA
ncbi:MAG: hypothetical protein ACTH31_10455, partial [Pseudoclavibacter sp.]